MEIVAKTMAGLEPVLVQELEVLGAQNIESLTRAVRFDGDQALLYKANFQLRTALRILVPIASFSAKNENQLYKKIYDIDWSGYMDVNNSLAVDAITIDSVINHSKYLALKTKDAIVDQFRAKRNRRPNVNVHHPDLRINIHLASDYCTVSLDSSGDSLHKRGYRQQKGAAPLNEVLSAGMILLSGWKADKDFIDPMCGSGTNLIEAAMIACQIPPQALRKDFGFMKWKDFHKGLWKQVKDTALAQRQNFPHQILGFDKEFKITRIAQFNIEEAGLEEVIEVNKKPFEKLEAPGTAGILLFNPPYEERMQTGDINSFYKMIGDQLKQQFSGYEAWIISSNKAALKHIGLRTSRKLTLYNGPLECKFHQYELYQGSKKQKYL